MEQAINAFKTAHATLVKCEQRIKDLWDEYVSLGGQNDKKTVKARKILLKQRSIAVTQCGNLAQKRNVAERKMIAAILAS